MKKQQKTKGIRFHILALVVVAFVPMMVVGSIAVNQAVESYKIAYRERMNDAARILAATMDREISNHATALTALATSMSLDNGPDGDLRDFDIQARRVADTIESPVVLYGPDARMRTHTERPLGASLPFSSDPDSVKKAFRDSRIVITDLVFGTVAQKPVVNILVPIIRNGVPIALLGSSMNPERLSFILSSVMYGEGYATLVDGNGVIVARSQNFARYLGQKAPTWFTTMTTTSNVGFAAGQSMTGNHVMVAFHKLSNMSEWVIARAEPSSEYHKSGSKPVIALFGGLIAALIISIGFAFCLGAKILYPISKLMKQADAVSKGGPVVNDETPAGITEFEMLRLSVMTADATMRDREARLSAIMNTAVDAIVTIDVYGVIKSFNPAAEKIFQYSADEIIGKSIKILMNTPHGCEYEDFLHRRANVDESKIGSREIVGLRKDGSQVPIDLTIAEWHDGKDNIFFTGIMRDITIRKSNEEQQRLLMREVDHRAKNALAVVQSLVRLTPIDDPLSFREAIEDRINALVRAHSMLAARGWQAPDLREIIQLECGEETRITSSGPDISISVTAVQSLVMVIHEMLNNAKQHGSLKTQEGWIEIAWQIVGDNLIFQWVEISPEEKNSNLPNRGFGSRLIETNIRRQLGGELDIQWGDPMRYKITIPLAKISQQYSV